MERQPFIPDHNLPYMDRIRVMIQNDWEEPRIENPDDLIDDPSWTIFGMKVLFRERYKEKYNMYINIRGSYETFEEFHRRFCEVVLDIQFD